MKTSPPAADHSRKSRTSPAAARRRQEVIDAVIRESIALYHQAQRAYARLAAAVESMPGDPALDNLLDVVTVRRCDAEDDLIRAILAPVRPPGRLRPEEHIYPPRGVRCDGRLYLVRPDVDDSCDLEPRGSGDRAMLLTVVDLARVADAGTIADEPVYRPDGSGLEHVDGDDLDAAR